MINFSIELGDGDVAVGVTKFNHKDHDFYYGLSFRDLVDPQEVGTNLRGKATRNFIAITVKNKAALAVLKEAVYTLERVMNGEEIEEIRDSIGGLNITELVNQRLEKELEEERLAKAEDDKDKEARK